MTIAIIDYEAGNIRSVCNALERIGCEYVVTSDDSKIKAAAKVIFPGVGEAQSAMQRLKNTGLDKVVPTLSQPVLGICVGLQLLCSYSEEGDTVGLGVFSETVRRFTKPKKVPHMGWNSVTDLQGPLFEGIQEDEYFYFVHSYCADKGENSIAMCSYEQSFSAALSKNNFYAVQFHPEKSGSAGAKLLENFIGCKE